MQAKRGESVDAPDAVGLFGGGRVVACDEDEDAAEEEAAVGGGSMQKQGMGIAVEETSEY